MSIRHTIQAYERLALFDFWLCEAGEGHNADTLIKSAATDGLAAGEKAAENRWRRGFWISIDLDLRRGSN
jgi:hypothetical protein